MKPFQNAAQKRKEHASSKSYVRHLQVELTGKKGGSIVHHIWEYEQTKNLNAINYSFDVLKHHIPHTLNFDKLINLTVSCGGKG